jgi:hypothetical protein
MLGGLVLVTALEQTRCHGLAAAAASNDHTDEMDTRRTWLIRGGMAAGIAIILASLYAATYTSETARICPDFGICQSAGVNHPHELLAALLAAAGGALLVASLLFGRRSQPASQ